MLARDAFTMIELIFVIVILGILAAVAIPKLSATRDDAIVSKIAMNVMTGAGEIAAYAVSHKNIDSNLSVMSNAVSLLVGSGDATLDVNSSSMNLVLGGSNCLTLKIDVNNTSGIDTLGISFDNNISPLCKALNGAIDDSQYPMKLRGTSVKY